MGQERKAVGKCILLVCIVIFFLFSFVKTIDCDTVFIFQFYLIVHIGFYIETKVSCPSFLPFAILIVNCIV